MNELSDTDLKDALARAIEPHVAFDGFGDATFVAACRDCGVDEIRARRLCPRGALDLAAGLHRLGDQAFLAEFDPDRLDNMRYSEKVAQAVWDRLLLAPDREVLRRATALFALPQNGVEGASLIWKTADAIWNAMGDTSKDVNWYTKRTILAGVYGSTVLFWLGDTGDGSATREFIDRRIANVMQFEKLKQDMQGSKVFGPFAKGLASLTAGVYAPGSSYKDGFPGHVNGQDKT